MWIHARAIGGAWDEMVVRIAASGCIFGAPSITRARSSTVLVQRRRDKREAAWAGEVEIIAAPLRGADRGSWARGFRQSRLLSPLICLPKANLKDHCGPPE